MHPFEDFVLAVYVYFSDIILNHSSLRKCMNILLAADNICRLYFALFQYFISGVVLVYFLSVVAGSNQNFDLLRSLSSRHFLVTDQNIIL